ncbi:hypothetical protein [Stenotrophomonas bentonitica]
MSKDRLLNPLHIPRSLWMPDENALVIPSSLRSVYTALLEERQLTKLAAERHVDGPVGGVSQQETDVHLAQSFSGSVARVMLAVLDPNSDVADASDAFIRCTSGSSICITDAPCGSGAAAAAFLCAMAELRAEGVFPREPLNVKIIGAEISEPAREYAALIMTRLSPMLAEQAIFVSHELQSWDVTCKLSTTDLVKKCVLDSHDAENKLLMIANFSGFLEGSSRRKASEKQFDELFRYASGKKSVAIWMEPDMNQVNPLFAWLDQAAANGWSRFTKPLTEWLAFSKSNGGNALSTAHAKFKHPLDSERTLNVRLAVRALSLERS